MVDQEGLISAVVLNEAIVLRRYLAPQRDVMFRLPMEKADWLLPIDKAHRREMADRTLRISGDLEAARGPAAVTRDELNSRLSDQTSKTMCLSTVVAAVLLPPRLIAGIFGINVGGMAGLERPFGSAIIVIAILFVAAVEVVLLRHLKWI